MKKYIWMTFALIAVVGVLWWGSEHVKQPPVKFLPMICAGEQFYYETEDSLSALPEGWTELGEISELLPDTEELPRRHLVSNCCAVGTKIYYPPRLSTEEVWPDLYALQENGTYLCYRVLGEE